jgi:hypothetical protein
MFKKVIFITTLFWLLSLLIWQLLFYSNSIIEPILWEIHTIYTSVIVFFTTITLIASEKSLDIIKIIFRILFKVWFIILLAFTMKKSFEAKAFILTLTFAFGYLEGLIDLNSWFKSDNKNFVFGNLQLEDNRKNRVSICIISIGFIHIISAVIAYLFLLIN